ncbi:M16 family metallopeptidase [Acidicapsa acidisoli]|uniref:M16 family metallopeptidase n=1 Tax=Acidicapsa acidisoli TaxID=1615681 RepID=UPI0021E06F30|nr:pitrilysin family protein [Acidicapsa acidisoli]
MDLKPRYLLKLLLLIGASAALGHTALARAESAVTRSTLPNGMRVVIIRNSLAPVVTVETNFIVGGNETPAGFPGMAHAQEHMAFRGCAGMNADQTAAIYAQLGGDNNADTQQNITQYYATIPAADLDIALQAQATCLRGVDDSDQEWSQERGAIEQEVARDLSNPTYKFISRLNEDMFAGTPYAHDPLGTKASFDTTTGQMLKDFYNKWYTPGNAILVIVGDIDPASTLSKIQHLFGDIPSHPLPARPTVELKPVKSESFSLDSNLPYVLSFIAYRLPGTSSPDYAAAQILSDVLASQRADVYAMVPAGKALAAEFGMAETYPKASVGYGVVAVPSATDISSSTQELKKILANYADKGVPEDLVAAAKRSEIAAAEFQRNSIPGLANVWSDALAAEGRTSPDEDIDAIRKVTLADVNRVAKQYLVDQNSITATLKPVPSGQPVADKGFGGGEKLTSAPTKPVQLPAWAASSLAQLKVPSDYIQASDTTLPNGIRLIVKTDPTSPTISVAGSVRHNSDLQTPPGQEGVSDLLDGLFSYGTQTLDRLAFQKALDDIAANESAGFGFSLSVLKENFSRGVQLLADNELHPALPADAFAVVQKQSEEFVAGNLQSPGYRTSRALDLALLPPNDPELREVTPATLSHVTLDEVKQFHASTFRPDLTTIVVIGDVSAAEAKTVIEKWFGDWKAAGPKPEITLPSVPANKPSTVSVPDDQQVQDSVVLAEQININRFDPDYYPLQLGNHVLGGGFYATRLYHDLRQTAGYVYTVDVSLDASKTRASYSVTYGCNPENVLKARTLIQRDLDQMRTEAVSADELHQAKALLLRQIPLSESSEEAVAGGLLRRAEIGLPLDEPIRAAKRYYELSADDVKAAFARQLRTGDLVQVVRGPAPH